MQPCPTQCVPGQAGLVVLINVQITLPQLWPRGKIKSLVVSHQVPLLSPLTGLPGLAAVCSVIGKTRAANESRPLGRADQ